MEKDRFIYSAKYILEEIISLKNLLFLTTDVPIKLNSGYRIRTYNTLNRLSKLYNIHILHICDFKEAYCEYNSYSFLQARQKKFYNLIYANILIKPFLLFRFSPKGLQAIVDKMIQEYDIDTIYMNMTVYDINIHEHLNLIVDQHDFISETMKNAYMAQKRIFFKLIYFLEYKKFEKYENYFYKKYDNRHTKIMCVKIEDSIKTKAIVKNSQVEVIENGFTMSKDIKSVFDPRIVIVGTSHQRNLNALHEFYFNILPYLYKKANGIPVYIVGAFKIEDLKFIDFKKYNISVHLFVDNLASYYEYGSISVLPYKMGGGSKLKVLESFGYGIPVVGYPLTFQGIKEASDFASSSSSELIDKIVELATNRSKYDVYAKRCSRIAKDYEWDIITQKMEKFLNE